MIITYDRTTSEHRIPLPSLEAIGHNVARVGDGEGGVVPVPETSVPRPNHQRDAHRHRSSGARSKGHKRKKTNERTGNRYTDIMYYSSILYV